MKIKALILINLFISLYGFSQANRGIVLYGGTIANKTLCNTIRVSGQQDYACKGGISYTFELTGKLKYSKHFSLEFGYQKLTQHLTSDFKDIKIYYVDNYSHTQANSYYAGMISYTDNIYLYGNHLYVGLNYELTKGKNNFNIGFSNSRINYRSKNNYITRDYYNIQTIANTPNNHYRSSINGRKLLGLNVNLKYERMIFKNKLGIYTKLMYHFNFPSSSVFEYSYDAMGYNKGPDYEFVDTNNGKFSNYNYYSFQYNSMTFSLGVFYKFNFKEKVKGNSKTPNT